MAYNANPRSTQARADFIPRTLEYTLPVTSYADGADIQVEVLDRDGTTRRTLSRAQMSVEALSGGGVTCTLIDRSGVFEDGDTLIVTRSTVVDDPSSYSQTGAAPSGSVRASNQRLFALIQELVARVAQMTGGEGGAAGLTDPQVRGIVTNAIAGITPQFTQALADRIAAAQTAAEVRSAINTALDGIDVDIRRVVDGSFVVALIDAAEGNTDWRTRTAVDVAVDGNQMTGTGALGSPITIIQGGIAAGLLAANAVATSNIANEAVTIDKLSAVLQGNWRNMLRSVKEISVSGSTATATRVDGTTFTFGVGTGMGGGSGDVEVFDTDPQGQPRSRGTFPQIWFKDATVVPGTGRVEVTPDFPLQEQADWSETNRNARSFIANRPNNFVQAYSQRPNPETLGDAAWYVWAGVPDALGGQGLYRTVPNTETPLNVVNATFRDTTALQAAERLVADITSSSNEWLLSVQMNASSSANPVYLWLRDDAPAAGQVYAAFRTGDGTGLDRASFGSTILFDEDTGGAPAGFTEPADSRRYIARPGSFPVNWNVGGVIAYGYRMQVRMTLDAGGIRPYRLKYAHVAEWVDDPEQVKHFLEGLKPGDRLSTHFLDDGAVARVVETAPTDFAGYKTGELVFVLTDPPALMVVSGNYDQSTPNRNRFTATTDAQGFASSADGDFADDPDRNLFSLRAIGGTGSATALGSFDLFLDAGDDPPPLLIARPVSPAGAPVFDGGTGQGTVLRPIGGHQGTVEIGARTYTGYRGQWPGQNPHILDSATVSYDLYRAYTSGSVNTPFNVKPATQHVPGSLVAVGGMGAQQPTVPGGGWTLTQVNAENREADNITVDASGFSGSLSPSDTTVQSALETLDGAGGLDAAGAARVVRANVDPRALAPGVTGESTDPWLDMEIDPEHLRSDDALPAVAGVRLGEIRNVGGILYVLVDDGTASNVLRGTTSGQGGGYVGDATLQWLPAAQSPVGRSWRLNVLRSALGASPPADLYTNFASLRSGGGDGSRTDIAFERDSGRDTATHYRYHSVAGEPQVDTNAGDWALTLWSNTDYRTGPVTVHSGNRWEKLDAVMGSIDPATRAEVYQRIRQIASAGRGVTLTFDDTAQTLVVSASRPAGINELPIPLVEGDQYILLREDTIANPIDVTATQQGAGNALLRTLDFAGRIPGWTSITAYGAAFPNPTLRGQTVLIGGSSQTMHDVVAVHARAKGGTDYTRYAVSASSLSSQFQHQFVVTGLTFAALAAGTELDLYLELDDGTQLPAGDVYEAGDWTADSPTHAVHTPGSAARWAEFGNTDPIPLTKIPRIGHRELIRGPGIGNSPRSSSQDSFLPTLSAFDSEYDLDSELNSTAILIVTGTYTLSGRGSNTIGFNEATSADDAETTASFFGVVRASDVLASPIYDGNTARGVKVVGTERLVRNGSAVLGEEAIYLGRAAGNLMGYVNGYDGRSGALSFSCTPDLTILVEHSDPGPAATALDELVDGPMSYGTAGQVPEVNATATGWVWGDKGTGGDGGLDRAAVLGLIADPAEQGNTDRWGTDKVPTLATLGGRTAAQVTAAITAAVLEPARNAASRWGLSKVPTLAQLGGRTAAQVMSAITSTVLAPAREAATRWSTDKGGVLAGGTTGQVYKRTATGYEWADETGGGGGGGSTTFRGLTDTPATYGTAGQQPAMNAGATALEWVDPPAERTSFSVAGVRSAITQLALSAASGPGSSQVWSDWVTLATATLTGAQQGPVIITGHSHCEVSEDPSGGGDRVLTETRLVRTRGTEVLVSNVDYIRNLGAGTLASEATTALQVGDTPVYAEDDAQVGDIYTLQLRAVRQATIARTLDFNATQNHITVSSRGGNVAFAPSGGKGALIATLAIPTAVQTGKIANVWSVESAFEGAGTFDPYKGPGGASAGDLFMPKCVPNPGWVVEIEQPAGTTQSCSWIPSNAIDPSNTSTSDATESYEQIFKVSGYDFDSGGAGVGAFRALNLRLIRHTAQNEPDILSAHGAGGAAFAAGTVLRIYEWLAAGKGDKGDPGLPGTNANWELISLADYNALAVKDSTKVYFVSG